MILFRQSGMRWRKFLGWVDFGDRSAQPAVKRTVTTIRSATVPVHRPLTPSAPLILVRNGVRARGALKDCGVVIGDARFSDSSGSLSLGTRLPRRPSILTWNAGETDVAVGAVLGSDFQAPTTQRTRDAGHSSG